MGITQLHWVEAEGWRPKSRLFHLENTIGGLRRQGDSPERPVSGQEAGGEDAVRLGLIGYQMMNSDRQGS